MMKRILVALDATPGALPARRFAVELARRHGALLTGVGVVDVPFITRPEAIALGATAYRTMREEAWLATSREEMAAIAQAFEAECRTAGVAWRVEETEGDPYETLKHQAALNDLIVLGRDTTFHPFYQDEPSVTDVVRRIVHENPRPLLVMPPEMPPGKALLIVADGSSGALRMLQTLLLLELWRDREVKVLGVAESLDKAEANRRDACEFLQAYSVPSEGRAVSVTGSAVNEIMDQASELKAGILAVSVASEKGWRRVLTGRQEIAFLKNCPVAVFVHS